MENLAQILPTSCPTVTLSQRLSLSESGFVFDPVTGNSATVNATGMAIMRQLQHDANVKSAVFALQKYFNVKSPVAERDIIEFTSLLCKYFK
jgi:hypothetical protein